MRWRTEEGLRLDTSKGEVCIEAGKTITLRKEAAIRLLEEGRISPAERAAYRIDSGLLGCHLWFAETREDAEILRRNGIAEVIYTKEEIRKVEGMDRDGLKAIHAMKEIIEDAVIEAITKIETEASRRESE